MPNTEIIELTCNIRLAVLLDVITVIIAGKNLLIKWQVCNH